jgi:hypothetical protein
MHSPLIVDERKCIACRVSGSQDLREKIEITVYTPALDNNEMHDLVGKNFLDLTSWQNITAILPER